MKNELTAELESEAGLILNRVVAELLGSDPEIKRSEHQIRDVIESMLLIVSVSIMDDQGMTGLALKDRLLEIWNLARADSDHWEAEAEADQLPDPEKMHLDHWSMPGWLTAEHSLTQVDLQRLSFAVATARFWKRDAATPDPRWN